MIARSLAVFLTLFTGFTGLVYQVTWQKYLATLLGSHSEATAAVLGLFLGGLSVGYWLFGVMTRTLVERAQRAATMPRLLLAYGAIEVGIGVYALVFPSLFPLALKISYLLPHASPVLGFASDVALAGLLIGPPAVLMGATIPILTQALSRSLDDATRLHALVYGINTAGAFAGALAAGFFLIPMLGLDGVLYATGSINLIAGCAYALLGMRRLVMIAPAQNRQDPTRVEGATLYLVVALLLGFAMMTFETILIRVSGLAFGSSQFTFSMVVAAFVLCIALGAMGVSLARQIPRIWVSATFWLLGALLLGLYAFLPTTSYWVYLLRTAFQGTVVGFYLYYACGFLLLLFIMGAPVLLSGAALPLLFHHLRREFGELGSLAGRLYSWNTLGSLVGALIGGYALFFWLDLHHVYRIVVAAVFAAAALLTLRIHSLPSYWALALAPLAAGLLLMPAWDPQLLTMGLFRIREPLPNSYSGLQTFIEKNLSWDQRPIHFYSDGPTTSVAVREVPHHGRQSLTVIVNGKADGNTIVDYATMSVVGLIPALMADQPKRAFVIGMGTGITGGVLANLDSIEQVVVAEISHGVIGAAPLFDFANGHASSNPKIDVVRGDAYRTLTRISGTFDVIVSEPSNPWVTGVEMLYSREFLELARDKLSPGGVYTQWFHTYETDDETLALVLRTYAQVFKHVSIWAASGSDIVLLGFNEIGPTIDHYRIAQRARQSDFAALLKLAEIDSVTALLARELLPVGVVHAAQLPGPIHTLYRPLLSDAAARAFFRGDRAVLPFTGQGEAARIGAKNSLLRKHLSLTEGPVSGSERSEIIAAVCGLYGPYCETMLAEWLHDEPETPVYRAAHARAREQKGSDFDPERLQRLVGFFSGATDDLALLTPNYLAELTHDYSTFYHHASPFDPDALRKAWARCHAGSPSRQTCTKHYVLNPELALTKDLDNFVEACMSRQRFEQICQIGLKRTQQMLSGGL